ncbi:hypothetical protein K458DRAFT_381658 [Lentithecium fluviatile CBS 122367]|uniref:DUF6604 domain-containing protein n=1 Tax=Lentithecium fluviatile CBS 122367 TaxID=1168545 RepID=A0A6G1JNS5_9PLEO|nr:hypothetical protein K458DRAFT_381658 [Lentithecium fluviatile CBS 122367]
MAPPPTSPLLLHSYRRYKTRMGAFVTWLASTVQETGEVAELFGDNRGTAPKDKNKGKNKSKGKAKVTSEAQPRIIHTRKTQMIQISDLVQLAQVIAGADIEVPKVMLYILRDVTLDWKPVDIYFPKTGNDNRVNEILDKVLTILKPECPELTGVEEEETTTDGPERISQIQSLLPKPVEPTDAGSSEWILSRLQKGRPDSYQLAPTDENKIFAAYCLLQDMPESRLHVQLDADVTRECEELQDIAKSTLNTVDDCLKHGPHEGNVTDTYYAKLLKPLKDLISERAIGDKDGELIAKAYKTKGPKRTDVLLKKHIMHSGLQLAEILEDTYERAMALHEVKVVLHLAHLYHAARQSRTIPSTAQWIDLNYMVARQKEHIFSGAPPELAHLWVSSYLPALGCSD